MIALESKKIMSELKAAPVLLMINGARANIILNRPEKRNAITVAMWRKIPEMIKTCEADPKVRLIVIQGAGGVFASGADIAEFETIYATRENAIANHMVIQAAMQAVETCEKPTLALIEGACVGGGCGLALACDFRRAAPGARFGITPGKLGLVYGVADTRRLVQAVGVSAAKDILFTGRLIDAKEAAAIGLVDALSETLEADADALANLLSQASRHTMRTTKDILRRIASGQSDDDTQTRNMFADSFVGPDFIEGFTAFMTKRKPNFQ